MACGGRVISRTFNRQGLPGLVAVIDPNERLATDRSVFYAAPTQR